MPVSVAECSLVAGCGGGCGREGKEGRGHVKGHGGSGREGKMKEMEGKVQCLVCME